MNRVITLMLLLLISFPAMAVQNSEEINWAGLKQAFEEYANYPSGTNATKVSSHLPKKNRFAFSNPELAHEAIEFIYDRYQLGMLERQVLSGDKQSVMLAYNLLSIADGGFAEDINITLGTLIRINPKLFLEGLREYQGLVGRISSLVGNQGYVYVDRLEASCYDQQLRIDSLSAVKDAELQDVKDKSIEALRGMIGRYCSDSE